MSDTPRTDCEIGNVRSITPHLESEEYYRALAHRLSNFSRVLERELAEKDALIREAMEALEYISRKASHGNLYGDEARDMCCDIGPVAQEVLARLRETEGGK